MRNAETWMANMSQAEGGKGKHSLGKARAVGEALECVISTRVTSSKAMGWLLGGSKGKAITAKI